MWPQYYETTVTRLVRECLVRLCVENVPYTDSLELDAIVCVSGCEGKQIVVRIHQQLGDRPEALLHRKLGDDCVEASEANQRCSEIPKRKEPSRKYSLPVVVAPEGRSLRIDCPQPAEADPDFVGDSPIDAHHDNNTMAYAEVSDGKQVCTTCSKQFLNISTLVTHVQSIHRRHACTRCGASFDLLCNLRRHERLHSGVHSGVRPHQCGSCGKAFARSTDLQRHTMQHVVCVQCKRVFDSPQDLRLHKCQAAAITEKDTSQLAKLLMVSRDDDPVKTGRSKRRKGNPSKVSTNSVSEDNLSIEMENDADTTTAEGLVKVKDEPVDTSATTPTTTSNTPPANTQNSWPSSQKLQQAALAHLKALHSTGVFSCENPGCIGGLHFSTFSAYEAHYVQSHARFPCRLCSQSFGGRNNRLRHEKSHMAGKPYGCTRCGKSFSRPDSLREHRFTHTRSYRERRCHNCAATFERKAMMLAHMKKCFRGVHIAEVDAGDVRETRLLEADTVASPHTTMHELGAQDCITGIVAVT